MGTKCSFCGKDTEKMKQAGATQGIVDLDDSGKLYLEFTACPDCMRNLVAIVSEKMRSQ